MKKSTPSKPRTSQAKPAGRGSPQSSKKNLAPPTRAAAFKKAASLRFSQI